MPSTDARSYFRSLALAASESQRPQLVVAESDATRTRTIASFWGAAAAHAAVFQARGVGRGDVVLIFARNTAAAIEAFFGAELLGAIPSFMPPPSPRQPLEIYRHTHEQLFARIRPALIVCDRLTAVDLENIFEVAPLTLEDDIAPVDPSAIALPPAEATALLQHSSGTTGLKKGVELDYGQIESQIEAYAEALALPEGASVVSWLPLYHDMGLIAATILPVVTGHKLVLMDTFDWLADPIEILRLAAAEPSAVLWLPNFAFNHLANQARRLRRPLDLSGVHAVINCSEPAKPASMARFIEAFAPHGLRPEAVQVCYALAENVFAATQTRPGAVLKTVTVERKAFEAGKIALLAEGRVAATSAEPGPEAMTFSSCGAAIDGTLISLRHADGTPAGADEVASVWLKGTSLFSGYYLQPELTASRMRDGWFNTNDLGFVSGGELYICGRIDDLIIVNGKNLLAHDIEASCNAVEGIKPGRCTAFGTDDPRTGSQSLVILAEAMSEGLEGIGAGIHQVVLGEFGIAPADIMVLPIDTLIKTTSGKISRLENKKRYTAGELKSWR